MREPIFIKKEAFQAIGISITTKNEKETSTEGKIPRAMEPILPRTK